MLFFIVSNPSDILRTCKGIPPSCSPLQLRHMTAAKTPITKAAELPTWAAPPEGALVVAAAVGPAAVELPKVEVEVEVEAEVACTVNPGVRLVVREIVAELGEMVSLAPMIERGQR